MRIGNSDPGFERNRTEKNITVLGTVNPVKALKAPALRQIPKEVPDE